ncbi:Ankyrin repeat domain-containing protein 13C [Armadillidium vulgare]|nr:Ankyrin repeat domain-containing protein 13C [Armadillidium vulgare]
MADQDKFELHEAIFRGDIRRASALIRKYVDLSIKDKHGIFSIYSDMMLAVQLQYTGIFFYTPISNGFLFHINTESSVLLPNTLSIFLVILLIRGNTPLHLAVMLGHKECIHLLLAHGAPVKVKNSGGWSPLAEAISYGDRQTIPLVSRMLPSDVCRIYKKGAAIRLDTTLVDFNDMRWERGDISFIFSGERKPNHSLIVLDNKLKVYQKVKNEQSEYEIEEEVDMLMSSDIVAAQMPMSQITFSRAQTGWIFKADKEEMVGKYKAKFYCLNGLTIVSRKRREHLSDEDLQKNKAIMESFTKGGSSHAFDLDKQPVRRQSLDPPKKTNVTWEEYIKAEPGHPPHLGRPLVSKESSKSFRATVAMSEDFPLTTEKLLSVLEVIAPFKHFAKLRDFIQMKLPPGFPVKIDIPILPTVSAKITFQEFEFRESIQNEYFEVPSDYIEDNNRFPDL